jgi:hypothetical protein
VTYLGAFCAGFLVGFVATIIVGAILNVIDPIEDNK